MPVNLIVNGVTYTYPSPGDQAGWGQSATDWATAVTQGVLQKSGGTFQLTAEVDFGASFGLKTLYLKSRTTNPSSTGILRLAKTDIIGWRNNANGGDLSLTIDTSDRLTFNGSIVGILASALTASRALVSDGSGNVSVATTTSTEIGYVNGVTSAIQTQINAKASLSGATFTGDVTLDNQKALKLRELTANGTDAVTLQAPSSLSAPYTLTLPPNDGNSGEFLQTDGSGVLTWQTAAGGGTINSGVNGRVVLYNGTGTTLDDQATVTSLVDITIASQAAARNFSIPDPGVTSASFSFLEGTQTFSGLKTFSAVLSATNDFQLSSTKKFYLDGGSDTYISEVSANRVDIFTNGSVALAITAGHNIFLNSGAGLYLDGGVDTFLTESAANTLSFTVGGTETFRLLSNTNVGLVATAKLFLDGVTGAGDTFIQEDAANQVRISVGGSNALYLNASDIMISAASKVRLDGSFSGDTYLLESSANVVDVFTGGSLGLRISAAQDVFTQDYTDYSATSTVTGWSSFTTKSIYTKLVGKNLDVWYNLQGTSNSSSVSFTLPFTAANTVDVYDMAVITDNGTNKTNPGSVLVQKNTSTATLGLDLTGSGGFTNTGTKAVRGHIRLQIV